MKRFFTYVSSFFKNAYSPVYPEVEERTVSEKVVLDSRRDVAIDDFDDSEEIRNFSPSALTYKQRILAVIELHAANFDNKPFTTAMVYNWLHGQISILAIRKAIYKLNSHGVLESCKKTYSNNKKVKFYSLKNFNNN